MTMSAASRGQSRVPARRAISERGRERREGKRGGSSLDCAFVTAEDLNPGAGGKRRSEMNCSSVVSRVGRACGRRGRQLGTILSGLDPFWARPSRRSAGVHKGARGVRRAHGEGEGWGGRTPQGDVRRGEGAKVRTLRASGGKEGEGGGLCARGFGGAKWAASWWVGERTRRERSGRSCSRGC